jgi:cell division protein FtsQ
MAPLLLRHVAFFRLRGVELVGVEYQQQDAVLDALDLADTHNIFESKRAVLRRAEALPGVVRAEIKRRLPGTLIIVVEERTPVALIPGPSGLVALDADAQPLPYDPSAAALDLPILAQSDSGLARTLSLVQVTDPTLFSEIEAAERSGNVVILQLGDRRILWGGIPSMRDIRNVQAVRRSLAAGGRAFDQLDARFAGVVFVRWSPA